MAPEVPRAGAGLGGALAPEVIEQRARGVVRASASSAAPPEVLGAALGGRWGMASSLDYSARKGR